MTHAATPTKLRTGEWGALCRGHALTAGETVTITTAAGKSWDATVSRVVYTDDELSVCTTTSLDRPAARPTARTWTGCRCGSIEEESQLSDCRSCRYDDR